MILSGETTGRYPAEEERALVLGPGDCVSCEFRTVFSAGKRNVGPDDDSGHQWRRVMVHLTKMVSCVC